MISRLIKAILAVSVVLAVSACSRVEPGQVGIKAYMLGGSKGVDHEVLTPGRYWIGVNERLYIFPTFTQNEVWTADTRPESPIDQSITFQTKEGLSINADFGITYSLEVEKIPLIFQKYRRGINEITDMYLYNIVRDSLVTNASQLDVETIYGVGKAEYMAKVEEDVRRQVAPIGIKVESLYAIGDFRLPQAVINRINDKIAATQKAQQLQNEVAQSKAEADKRIEEARGIAESLKMQASAQAESNRLLAASINPTLVEWERLQVQRKQIERWDGAAPRVVGANQMLLSVDPSK